MQYKAGTQALMWDRCYGRDGRPLPTELNDHVLAQTAMNVELTLDTLPRRRAGSSSLLFGGVLFTGFVKPARFYGKMGNVGPNIDEYLFWSDTTGKIVWAPLTGLASAVTSAIFGDTYSSFGRDVVFCQFNGKMYVARQSSADRLHVIDARLTGPTILRRVGLPRPTAPTVTNQGAGAITGFRYYRTQFKRKLQLSPGIFTTVSTSNLGDPTGFNPSGTGASVRVAVNGPLPAEDWNYWVVYASMDNALYYNISGDLDLFVTSNFDDANVVTDYPNFPAAPDEGAYNTWPSVKFLLAGIDRLIGFGVTGGADGGAVSDARAGNVSTPGRVWFSPVLGTQPGTDDDERVPVVLAGSNPIQNWIDVGRGMGLEDRGLGGPIDGNILVFQSRAVFLLVPTGNVYAPFKRVTISTDVGAIEGSIFTGQDELGRPCVYFVDETAGPFRYGAQGLQWLGFDVRDEWTEFNRLATDLMRAHGVFHNESQTAFFWFAKGTTPGVTTCNRLLRFNARLGKDTGPTGVRFGWVVDDNDFATATGSAIVRFGTNGPGLQPNAVFQPLAATGTKALMRDPAKDKDDTSAYLAVVRSKVLSLSGAVFQIKHVVTDWVYLQAARLATTVLVSLFRNYNTATPPSARSARSLAPTQEGSEDRVLVRCEGLSIEDAFALQAQIQDNDPATALRWQLDYLAIPVELRTQERWNTNA